MKYSIFHVQGGIGKHIAATAVAQTIKNNHPDRKLIIVCAYPDIFLNLDFVHRVYVLGHTQYFYQEYVQDKDSLIFYHEPYFTNDHIYKRLPLIQNWCKLYNLKYSGELPTIKYNKMQFDVSKKHWYREKPIMLIHTNGGPMTTIAKPYSWTRDMPFDVAQELTDYYKKDYSVFQLTKLNSPKVSGAEHIYATQDKFMATMEYFTLVLHSEKRILIDSSVQHAAAALNKPSTVLWNGTSPLVFGYEMHKNITAQAEYRFNLPNSYLFDFDFDGNEADYPYADDAVLFDIDKIIEATNDG